MSEFNQKVTLQVGHQIRHNVRHHNVRHPERVFLREGSPDAGIISNRSIGINRSVQEILRAKRRAQDDVPCDVAQDDVRYDVVHDDVPAQLLPVEPSIFSQSFKQVFN